MGMIANAGSGRVDAADQVRLKPWYNDSRGWNQVYRHPNRQLSELAADLAIRGCNNDHVLYSQGDNQGYWRQLQANNYEPSNISVDCYTDCFAFVCANYHAAARLLGVSELEGMTMSGTNSAPSLRNVGFAMFTDTDHTRTDSNAEKGDIYLCNGHGCMYVGDGTDTSGILPGGSAAGAGKFSLDYLGISEDGINPYIYTIPANATSVDAGKIKENRGFAAMLYGGKLYSDIHVEYDSFAAKNIERQVDCCIEGNLPWALWVDLTARNDSEMERELRKLYYVVNAYKPALGLWVNPKFLTKDKSKNTNMLEKYHESFLKWGLGYACGLYVDEGQLEKIDFDSISSKYYLWFKNPVTNPELMDDVYLVADIFSTDVERSNNPVTPQLVVDTVTDYVNNAVGMIEAALTGKGRKIVEAAQTTGSPGAGYCAKWVSQVYQAAGLGYPPGNACDQYAQVHGSKANGTPIEPGMIIAVSKWSGTDAGRIYGHVGIYIGNNTVRHNVGNIVNMGLDDWIAKFGDMVEVRWGYLA